MKRRILIADDDESLRKVAAFHLREEGHEVAIASDGLEGLQQLERDRFDLVVTDMKMPNMGGLELLKWVKERSPSTQVIVMTGFATISDAVNAIKEGAFDFLTKPLDYDQFRIIVRKALEFIALQDRVDSLERELERKYGREAIVHASRAMSAVLDTAEKVAASDAAVLITGESGTGKELIARMIHYRSPRRERELVSINCAAIPHDLLESELFGHEPGAFTGATEGKRGKFEIADGGTLFLDEIGELPIELQAKLLRALESGEINVVGRESTVSVDVRVVAATNRDLARRVEEGSFREDLFYRINVISIDLPPLRERPEDIPVLAKHFCSTYTGSESIEVDDAVFAELRKRSWPGNVRELRNTCEQMLVLRRGKAITVDDIPSPALGGGDKRVVNLPPGGCPLEEIEKEALRQALRMTGGNRSRAAALLEIPRHKLLYRLEKYGMD